MGTGGRGDGGAEVAEEEGERKVVVEAWLVEEGEGLGGGCQGK